jgi:hypothetical protein
METLWADIPLDADEGEQHERAGSAVVVDESVRLLARENRIGIWRGETRRNSVDGGAGSVLDVPLRCVAHPHPDCRFRWVRLVVDFGTDDSIIIDLSPREVRGVDPVKIVTQYSGGLSFEVERLNLGPEFSLERSSEQQVYFPDITSSGLGLSHAIWDFHAVGEAPLHVDRDLRLLVRVPISVDRMEVKFTLRASVAARGLTGLLPVLGRKKVEIEAKDLVR